MTHTAEIVIVGAGVAGGSLAAALARQGTSVLLLEKSLVHRDRARGEFVVPWGVDEARRLGVLDVLLSAGGHYTTRAVTYGEEVAQEAALARAFDLTALLPNVRGGLAIGNPQMSQALDDAAQTAGATFLRGVKDLKVAPGNPPKVAFVHEGLQCELTPRLVIAADGTGSSVARQIGAKTESDLAHHFLAGMLVEGVEVWPEDLYTFGTEGEITFYIFPQGGGKARLSIGYALNQRRRFAGPAKAQNFLDAFRLRSVPHSKALSRARPIGPCHGYPNADTWVDTPVTPGVVLIGDAAGHNDPSIGQGLSICLRDARLVLEAILGNSDWSTAAFAPYVEERRERMRRLRFTGQQFALLRGEFTEAAKARRRRAVERIVADPNNRLPLLPLLLGPFNAPPAAFEQAAWDRLMN